MRKILPLLLLLTLSLTACGGNEFFWEDAGDYDASDPQYKLDEKGRSTVAEATIAEEYESSFDPAWGKPKKNVSYSDLIDDFGDDYGMDTTTVEYTFTEMTEAQFAELGTLECGDGSEFLDPKLATSCGLTDDSIFETSLKMSLYAWQDVFKDGRIVTVFSFEYDPRYE